MLFIPFLLIFTGLTLLLSRYRTKTTKNGKESLGRVIAKGHTYSDSVETVPVQRQERSGKVESVHRCCIIGAGRVGATTAISLASRNPEVQFFVVDQDERLVTAWKSNQPPIFEPGLDAMLWEDEPVISVDASQSPTSSVSGDSGNIVIARKQKLPNVTFSTDVHAGVAAAEMVFLCVETPCAVFDEEDRQPDLSGLHSAIQAIAHAATGHKIIVQRTTAPCGMIQEIKKRLKDIASPSATFDVLSNPEFIVPGSALQDLLHPPRIIIGHIYTSDMSPEALTVLKRLYTPWVPEDRIITMDAWSSELGKIAANALIAQQISSLNALSMLCESTNADIRHIVEMAGPSDLVRCRPAWSTTEVQCLVYLARELGLQQVAEYWGAVLRMEEFHQRHIARRVISHLEGDLTGRKVAILGVDVKREGLGLGWEMVKELVKAGVVLSVYDPHVSREQVQEALRLVHCVGETVMVADSLETACRGCSAVVFYTDCDEFRHDQVRWQGIAGQMKQPRVVLDPGSVVDRFQMQQCGFKVLRLGVSNGAVERRISSE